MKAKKRKKKNNGHFELKDVHKKIGQLIHIPCTESDIVEGEPFCEQLWFVESDRTMWLMAEYWWDEK